MNKILSKYFVLLALLGISMIACEEDQDVVTADAKEGGAVLRDAYERSSGKFLGVKSGEEMPEGEPAKLESISETVLSYNVSTYSGGQDGDIESYTIVKTFNGANPIEIATIAPSELPYTFTYSSKEEFFEGFGISKEDLRIGYEFAFYTQINMKDGRELISQDSYYYVTISCASNLAGTYTLTGKRGDGTTYGPLTVTVTETSPGSYVASRSGAWNPGILATPTGEAPIVFSDVCNEIFIPQQNLGDYYSNQVYGVKGPGEVAGEFDPSTGKLTLRYIIEFASGNSEYTDTYTPQ